jgi:hypothetical protein
MAPMTWTAPAVERAGEPTRGNELEVLTAWLDFHRDTLSHKCSGLTEAQLKTAAVDPSPLTLLGIVRHMTELERWLRSLFTGKPEDDPYYTDEQPDAAFLDIANADAKADLELFRQEVELTRKAVPLRDIGESYFDDEEGEDIDIRAMYVHVLEEYARHNGHADLIRERIDGSTGT